MSFQKKIFVLGEKIPDWFNEQLSRGRAKLKIVDDEIVGAVLNKPTGWIDVGVGDSIVLTKNGLSVKAREAAKEKVSKTV